MPCARRADPPPPARARPWQVLNCGSAEAREYSLAVLRRWAGEGVDGFCFINAENMVQGARSLAGLGLSLQANLRVRFGVGAAVGRWAGRAAGCQMRAGLQSAAPRRIPHLPAPPLP